MAVLAADLITLTGIPLGRLDVAQKAAYHSPAALSHEPGHTCLLFETKGLLSPTSLFSPHLFILMPARCTLMTPWDMYAAFSCTS